jgi:hypothetical protein
MPNERIAIPRVNTDIALRDSRAIALTPFHQLEEDAVRILSQNENLRSTLREIGALQFSSVNDLTSNTRRTFQDACTEAMDSPERQIAVQTRSLILQYTGLIVPNTRLDWCVTRYEDESGRIGISSFPEWERDMINEYTSPYCHPPYNFLTKGPGTGQTMARIRNEMASSGFDTREYGIGDALYHDIFDLLMQLVHEHMHEDPGTVAFVEELARVLARKLDQESYATEQKPGSIVKDRKRIVPFVDLNRIFILLSNPEDLLGDVFRYSRSDEAHIRTSNFYPDDSQKRLPLEVHTKLLRLLGLRRELYGDKKR